MYARPRPSRTNPAFLYDIVGRDIEDDVAKCFDNATTCPNSGSAVVTWVPAKSTAYTPTSKVASVTDADGRVTSYAYDDADRPLRTVDPIGRQVRYVFDAAGQMSKEIHDWHSGTGCAVSGTLQECYATYTYGNDGEKLTVMDANGAIATVHYSTAYLYDGFNRLNVTTFPDGSTEQIPLTGGYDANGNILTRITRAGQTMSYLAALGPSPTMTCCFGCIYLSVHRGNTALFRGIPRPV